MKKAEPKGASGRIILRPRRSRFVEIFRTTPTKTVCPNFYVLAHANGCAFSPHCSYCYLKSSFWFMKGQHAFTNKDRMFREIRSWIRKDGLESYILNSGNLCDSLSFEAHRPLNGELVELFRTEAEARGRPHSLLLVTKGGTREAAPLLKVPPCRNVIVSFSVNHPDAGARYERGAAPVADRMAAAWKLKHKGWRVRIRIDPMIDGFDYDGVARQVRTLDPERITLGTLRMEPNLDRFLRKDLIAALEVEDKRTTLARYPLARRLALYRRVIRILGRRRPIGLCEETYDVWEALGLDPANKSCNCGG